MLVAITASLHYLALGIGLGSVFMRGRHLADLAKDSVVERKATLRALFAADNIWGLAALLWVVTGIARAFGGLEKGTDFYLGNSLFLVKMLLFFLLFILETPPMITFIKWRISVKKGVTPTGVEDARTLRRLRQLNAWEIALVLLIPFVASLMARGIGYRLY